MEPPTKRPRTGMSPFNDEEEIDGDELNLEPERVNALRDPGYQLEKSRAFAASKLKSAFERIFEKYERDFEGEADEIDLSTGKIVIDNGHIQSLAIATLNAEDESGDEDGAEDEVIDEDERILQGKGGEKLLSRMGENQNSSLTALVRSPGQNNQQHEMGRVIGGSPKLSSMIYPPQVQFGPVPMQYGFSGGLDHWVDPAWRAPELPPPRPRAPVLRLGTTKKLLSGRVGHAENGNEELDEDDILLGVSTTPMATPNSNGLVKRMKKLIPPGSASGTPGTASKSTPKRNDGHQKKLKGSAGKQKATPKPPKDKELKKPNSKDDPASKHDIKVTENEATQNNASSSNQVVAVRSKRSKKTVPPKDNCREEPDAPKEELYVDHSSPSGKRRPLPKNQKLAVEIISRKELDMTLLRLSSSALSPEEEPESCEGPRTGASDQIPVVGSEPQSHRVADLPRWTSGKVVREKESQPQEPETQELFSRIVLDPSYTFSDDDEPALPKARAKSLARKENKKVRGQKDMPHEKAAISPPETTQKMITEEEPQPQKPVVEEEFSRIVLDPSFAFSDDEEPALPKARAKPHPVLEERVSSREQRTRSSEPPNPPLSNQDLDQEDENEAMVWAVEREVPLLPTDSHGNAPVPKSTPEKIEPSAQLDILELAPTDGGRRSVTLKPVQETNEPRVEAGSPKYVEPTPQGDVSELAPTGPNEITEQYSPQLLKRKPRRKRKIPAEFLEEDTLTLPETADEEVPTEPLITAPSKRLKKRKQTPPEEFQEFGGQLGELTEQIHVEPLALDGGPHETRPASSPVEALAIPESPQPEAALAELAIPESPQLEIPILRTSLLEVEEEEEPVVLPDPEDIDVDSPPQTTLLPSLSSPELGENLDGPSTSPLPYSSPSKAVKAVKRPRPTLPTTPINKKGKQPRPRQQQGRPQVSEPPNNPPPASASSSRTASILSLISDDEDEETDELSLTPRPRYYTPPNGAQRSTLSYTDRTKHTSLTAPLLRMKLLSSGNPRTPSSHKVNTTSLIPTSKASKMYFSADRRVSSSSAAGARSSVKRRRSQMMSVVDRRPANPVSPEYADESSETVVQTPGGTKRKCGEDGFHCNRDFCFVCL